MGAESLRNSTMKNIEDISVPPGFVSLTSFTLKRVENSEQTHCSMAGEDELEAETSPPDAKAHTVDVTKLKRSLRHRPWILTHELDHVPVETDIQFDVNVPLRACLPKGVIRGCSSCENCLKVIATWHPEESRMPQLEEVPVFHPTDEEFKDPLNYVASIRSKAEIYGICRIVPPDSWETPCLLKENTWKSSKFNTYVQRINELQNPCLESEYCAVHEDVRCKRRKVLKSLACESSEGPTIDGYEGESAESFKFESGPEFTLESFQMYADNFLRQYFSKKDEVANSSSSAAVFRELDTPSAMDVEGEYWRIIEKPSEEIEVLSAIDVDTRLLRRSFPVKSNSVEVPKYHGCPKSDWNLNNIPTLPGSLLGFESCETSATLFPRLSIGMCFSSFCWSTEEHRLYSLCYSHIGAPRIWYCVPGKYHSKFKEVVKKHHPQLSQHPELLHKLVTQLSPSTLAADGIPVYRCTQNAKEFVVIFPGVYKSVLNCGFSCSEAVNFAPLDWLPHGQNIIDLYSEQHRKTSISHDKILLGAANRAVRAQWEFQLVEDTSSDNELWRRACGNDSVLFRAFTSRIKQESIRREYLCNSSLSRKRKMKDDFDATTKRECCICLYDLHLSAASCSCSPGKYTCLCHAKQLCSCPWTAKSYLFRYEINELNVLAEALEGKVAAIRRWASEKLGLTVPHLMKDAEDRLRHRVKSTSMNPVEQRTSNFADLTSSSGVSKHSTVSPDAAIKGSLDQGKCLITDDDGAKRVRHTVSSTKGMRNLDETSSPNDQRGTLYRGCQVGEDLVLVSNQNIQAHKKKEGMVKESSAKVFSRQIAAKCSNSTQGNSSISLTKESSQNHFDVIVIDDEDE